MQDFFFACGSSAPVRVELHHKGGGAAWLSGTLAAVCRDTDCLRCRNYDFISLFSSLLESWQWEGLFRQSFSVALHIRHLEGSLAWSPSLLLGASGTRWGPWLESYSVVQCIRHLMGQPLYCSAATLACGGRGVWRWLHPPCMTQQNRLASMAAQHFLHRHFPPQSPPSHPLDLSLHSQQQPSPWDCSTIPKLQIPAAVPSRGPASLSKVCMTAVRTVWFSFHLGCRRSAVSPSALNASPLTQTIAAMWGLDPCFSSPTHKRQVQSY